MSGFTNDTPLVPPPPRYRSPGRRAERKLLGGKSISTPAVVLDWDNAPEVVRDDQEFRTLAGMAKQAKGEHRASLIAQMRARWNALTTEVAS